MSTTAEGSPPGHYFPFADVNGDSRISATDYAQVFRRLNTFLPQPAPPPAPAPPPVGLAQDLFGAAPILA